MSFERGKVVEQLHVIGERTKSGTKVTFKPDTLIFPDTEYRFETLAGRLRELAHLNPGLTITLEDQRTGKTQTYHYPDGILHFVRSLNEGKNVVFDPPIGLQGRGPGEPRGPVQGRDGLRGGDPTTTTPTTRRSSPSPTTSTRWKAARTCRG